MTNALSCQAFPAQALDTHTAFREPGICRSPLVHLALQNFPQLSSKLLVSSTDIPAQAAGILPAACCCSGDVLGFGSAPPPSQGFPGSSSPHTVLCCRDPLLGELQNWSNLPMSADLWLLASTPMRWGERDGVTDPTVDRGLEGSLR